MSKSKKKTYYIQADISVLTSVEVAADSLQDALDQAKLMKVSDFVEVPGDHIDSELEITGVYS